MLMWRVHIVERFMFWGQSLSSKLILFTHVLHLKRINQYENAIVEICTNSRIQSSAIRVNGVT